MNEIDLGKIAITNKGKWEINTPYDILTSVSYNGLSYLSRVPNIGINPEEDSSMNTWLLLAERGESIYNLSVESGKFTGTEEEFIAAYWKAVNDAIKAALDANSAAGSVLDSIDTVSRLEKEITLAENLRVISENTRKENESYRERDEQIRENNEKNREKQEQEREINVQNSINSLNRAMQDASIAELKREQQEAERVKAEGLRDLEFKEIKAEAKDTAEVSNAAAKNASDAAIRANSAADRADVATGNTLLAINNAVTATTAANQATNKSKTATEESIKATEASKIATSETIAAKNETIAAAEEAKKATTNANNAAENAKTFEPRIKTLEDDHVGKAPIDGNMYLRKDGKWFDITPTLKDLEQRLRIAEIPESLIPQPIAKWSARDKSNDDVDKDVLKDLTGNGHDIKLNNFAFAGDSGYGLYEHTFDDYKMVAGGKNSKNVDFTNISFKLNSNGLFDFAYGYLVFNITQSQSDVPSNFKIKVSGLPSSEYGMLVYWYNIDDKPEHIFEIKQDGVYTLPTFNFITNGNIGFRIKKTDLSDYGHWKNLKIEIVPKEKDCLVFDGVDDYGICENMSIFTKEKGYTIIAKRMYLNNTNVYSSFVTKRKGGQNDSAFMFERQKDTVSFGSTLQYGSPFNGTISFQNSKRYNNMKLPVAKEVTDYPTMILGGYSADIPDREPKRMAFYELHIFDYDLTPEEIELYIRKKIDPSYRLPVV